MGEREYAMLEEFRKKLYDADPTDLANGYLFEENKQRYRCMFCEMTFENGRVYPVDEQLLLAEKAIRAHIRQAHGDVFESLLGLGKQHTGLSEIQQTVLLGLFHGESDKQIAHALGGKSVSTVRNHRFQLRKRKKEAKLLLALMELIERREPQAETFVEFHADLPTQDERAIVTKPEERKLIDKYFAPGPELKLSTFPRKQKAKLVILNRISERFSRGRRYSEPEVNDILAAIYDDFVMVRRYLIDYMFLDRTPDGREYWIK